MNINLVIFSFGIGTIPFAAIVSFLYNRKKTLSRSKKNTGTRNVYHAIGIVPGLITLSLDILKGWFLMMMILSFEELLSISMIYLMIGMAGHAFSPFLRFKGGQGVAMLVGGMLYVFPWVVLLSAGIFLLIRKLINSFDLRYTLVVVFFLIFTTIFHAIAYLDVVLLILLFLFPLLKGFCFPSK